MGDVIDYGERRRFIKAGETLFQNVISVRAGGKAIVYCEHYWPRQRERIAVVTVSDGSFDFVYRLLVDDCEMTASEADLRARLIIGMALGARRKHLDDAAAPIEDFERELAAVAPNPANIMRDPPPELGGCA